MKAITILFIAAAGVCASACSTPQADLNNLPTDSHNTVSNVGTSSADPTATRNTVPDTSTQSSQPGKTPPSP
jgi:hypothetical protein